MSDLLVLYGATGTTGSHILPVAVQAGLRVRCYVRTPSKIPASLREHPAVEVVRGTFEDTEAVAAALKGADMAICVGGGPSSFKRGMMLRLAQSVVAGMRRHGVRRLVYQAGALSPEPGKRNPPLTRWLLRPVLGTLAGMEAMLRENDEIMAWVAAEASDLNWTFTRPGQITTDVSQGTLRVSDKAGARCSAVDLARLTVELANASAQVHDFPYVGYDA